MRHLRLTSFVLSEPRMILWTPGLLPGLVSNRVPDHGPVLWPTGYEAVPRSLTSKSKPLYQPTLSSVMLSR